MCHASHVTSFSAASSLHGAVSMAMKPDEGDAPNPEKLT